MTTAQRDEIRDGLQRAGWPADVAVAVAALVGTEQAPADFVRKCDADIVSVWNGLRLPGPLLARFVVAVGGSDGVLNALHQMLRARKSINLLSVTAACGRAEISGFSTRLYGAL